MTLPVTFLSDYGHIDEFVGVVHGVIARICPEARIIDISHGVPRQAVPAGAMMLERALSYVPAGVHLAVVDPDVGARRRAVALRTVEDDRILVGPDNGLLMPAGSRFGGVAEAYDISASEWRLDPVSATFHGRDIFAPVVAHLAAGAPLAESGAPLDPATLVELELPRPRHEPDALVAHALWSDAFGNVQLDAAHEDAAICGLKVGMTVRLDFGEGEETQARYVRTFADVGPGDTLLYEDAAGRLAVAINTGHAAKLFGVWAGDEIRIEPSG